MLAPLTRLQNDLETRAPVDLVKEYYLQRTTRGSLLIAEATAVSASGVSYNCLPGIYTEKQQAVWKEIVDARQGRIHLAANMACGTCHVDQAITQGHTARVSLGHCHQGQEHGWQ